MSYLEEFSTVDLIVGSTAETRGVDAFALSLIKAERQIRRLMTHLVYQFPCFRSTDIEDLRGVLANNRRVYFEGFERGFDAIYPRTIKDLIGAAYPHLRPRIAEAIDHRNKIFHGQLTSKYLTREDLLAFVTDICTWCEALAQSASSEFQYDGFERNSFQKSVIVDLTKRYRQQITDLSCYEQFIRTQMQR